MKIYAREYLFKRDSMAMLKRVKHEFLLDEQILKIKNNCWFYIRSRYFNENEGGIPILCLRKNDDVMVGANNHCWRKDDANRFLCKIFDIKNIDFEVSYSLSDWMD